jgi:hypothetical protein
MRNLFVLIILISVRSYAQNLVPNPGFELYNSCNNPLSCTEANVSDSCTNSCCVAILPNGYIGGNSGTYNWWTVMRANYMTCGRIPMYFNGCILDVYEQRKRNTGLPIDKSWYKPRTGEAFIAIYTFGNLYCDSSDYRDYVQVKLNEPLQAGCQYEASCFALFATDTRYFEYLNDESQAADGLGMYLAKDSIFETNYPESYVALSKFTPQVSNPSGHLLSDSVHYQKVSGIFTAQGGEEWLVIGNFKDNKHTITATNSRMNSIYAIDDVCVQEYKPNLIYYTDTTLCSDSTLVVTLPEGLKNYKWSTGETTQQISILADGTYTVEATNGCIILRDTFTRKSIAPYSDFTLGNDTFFCSIPASYMLNSNKVFDQYLWSTGSHASNIQIANAGTYWVNASYICGTLKDTIVITEFVKPDSVLIPANDTTICSNSSIDLQIAHPSAYSTFIWNDGSAENHLLVSQANAYAVKAYTIEGCEISDSIRITTIGSPVLSLQPDTILCEGSEIKLIVSKSPDEHILWNDGSIDSFYRVTGAGTYWATLSNTCFNTTDSITVTFVNCTTDIPNLITVNGDSKNDYFVIQAEVNRLFELSIYTAWGSQIYHDPAYQNSWNAEGLDSGIYFYYINDPLLKKNYKGWVQVIKQ